MYLHIRPICSPRIYQPPPPIIPDFLNPLSLNDFIVMKKHKNCRMTFLLLLLSGSLQLVAQTEIQLAQTFLEAHAEELGLQPGDYACLQLQNHYQSSLSQVQHYYFSQCHQGIGVHRAVLNLHYKADGELLTWGNRFVPDLASKIQGTT
ncbi:MAG: hypothetical protein AAB316_10525, partial [Bacteroidota bacterium]